MTIGERIKQRRIEIGLTQSELAIKMGYSSKACVSQVEVGGDNVTTTKVNKFAEALNTTPSYLMGWDEKLEQADTKLAARLLTDPDAARLVEKIINLPPDVRASLELFLDSALESKKIHHR